MKRAGHKLAFNGDSGQDVPSSLTSAYFTARWPDYESAGWRNEAAARRRGSLAAR